MNLRSEPIPAESLGRGVDGSLLAKLGLHDLLDALGTKGTTPGQLGTQLIEAEARRAQKAPLPNSMDLLFQGKDSANKGQTPENMAQARGFYEQALALDPGNIEALVGTAGEQ